MNRRRGKYSCGALRTETWLLTPIDAAAFLRVSLIDRVLDIELIFCGNLIGTQPLGEVCFATATPAVIRSKAYDKRCRDWVLLILPKYRSDSARADMASSSSFGFGIWYAAFSKIHRNSISWSTSEIERARLADAVVRLLKIIRRTSKMDSVRSRPDRRSISSTVNDRCLFESSCISLRIDLMSPRSRSSMSLRASSLAFTAS